MDAAHAAVAQMRALLAERRDVLRAHQEKTARMITPDLNAIMGPHNLARLAASKADAQRRQDNLDSARMQVADAIDGVLAWLAAAMAALEEKRPELQKKLDEQRANLAKPK